MAWALHRPRLHGLSAAGDTAVPVATTRVRPTIIGRPSGLGLVGLSAILTATWGGIVPFVGPEFGFRATADGSWHWSLAHALLYVAPGAVGVVAGLLILSGMLRDGRGLTGLAGLALFACGAWFVMGPAVWPIFYAGPVFSRATSDTAAFVNQVGYNLGPGVLLATFAGMALKALMPDRLPAERVERVQRLTTPEPAVEISPPTPPTASADESAESVH
ncbi:MAG TPA: hypothetical protein VF942_11315 [Acidimicrobiales bacterium]